VLVLVVQTFIYSSEVGTLRYVM